MKDDEKILEICPFTSERSHVLDLKGGVRRLLLSNKFVSMNSERREMAVT